MSIMTIVINTAIPNSRSPMMSNANTALVTGASAGIGAVYADRLARRGHDLILVARDQARLNALAARLRAETGRSVDILAADLAARSDLLRVEHRLRQDPSIAMLVNNAGIAVAGPMHGSDLDRLEAMVNINIMAALRLAHAAVDGFMARGRGTLINVSSVLALAPEQFNAVYSGTKSFMLNFSMALQTELANPASASRQCCPVPPAPKSGVRPASMSRRCRRTGSWTPTRWSTRRSRVWTSARR